jgi:hypothetical protein
MVYTLVVNFEGEKFSLVCKDGMEITTNPAAIKGKMMYLSLSLISIRSPLSVTAGR